MQTPNINNTCFRVESYLTVLGQIISIKLSFVGLINKGNVSIIYIFTTIDAILIIILL